MNYDKLYKVAKGIAYGLLGAFLGVFILLCVTVGVKNKNLKTYKAKIKAQTEQIDSLTNRCNQLSSLEGIQVNTTFVVNNKTVLGVNTNAINDLSRTYATFTRGEVLYALDSLKRANNKE